MLKKERENVSRYKSGWLQSHKERVCFGGPDFLKDALPTASSHVLHSPSAHTHPSLSCPWAWWSISLMCSPFTHKSNTFLSWSHRWAYSQVLGDLEIHSTLEGSILCSSDAEPGPGLPRALHLWGLCLDNFSDFEQGAHLACRFGHSHHPHRFCFSCLQLFKLFSWVGKLLDFPSGRFPDAGLRYWNILSGIPALVPAKFH